MNKETTNAQTATVKPISKLERRAQKKEQERLAKEKSTPAPETKVAPKTDTPKDKGEKAKKVLENATIEKASAAAEERTLMYIYPAEVKTQEDKKTFRRKMRAENNRFAKNIAKLKKSAEEADKKELAKIEKEYQEFRKSHYTKPL